MPLHREQKSSGSVSFNRFNHLIFNARQHAQTFVNNNRPLLFALRCRSNPE
jgi:hypothetical protein